MIAQSSVAFLSGGSVVFGFGDRWASRVRALDGIDFLIDPGERVAIVGPNGSGKSTLLNVFSGRVDLNEGQLFIGGRDVGKSAYESRARTVALVTQRTEESFSLELSVLENLLVAATKSEKVSSWRRFRPALSSRVETIFEGIGSALAEKKHSRAHELSGGQRQFLALAMALAQRPRLILLDEHTAALDPRNRAAVVDATRRLAEDGYGRSLIMVTHRVGEAIELDGRIVVMNHGRIVNEYQRGERCSAAKLEEELQTLRRVEYEVDETG